jgi:carboxymethylenebutenolidase
MGEWVRINPGHASAYRARPASGEGPGVLVLHAWWGLTPVFTAFCDRLAASGFVALAPSLYPGGETTAEIAEAERLVAEHDRDPAVAEGIALAALDSLRGLPGVTGARAGVIGFSLGAYWALHMSCLRPERIGAVVSVYGSSEADFMDATAAYLGHFAEHDEFEPLSSVRALEERLRAAGRTVEFHIYPGTGHWFVEPDRPDAYDAGAAELVWERTLTFLRTELGLEAGG